MKMYNKLTFRFFRYFILAILAVSLFSACKSKKYTGNKNQYHPAPPIKNEFPVVEKEPPVQEKPVEQINFEIAVILPFELKANLNYQEDELSDPQLIKSSLPAMHFYEGALMAIDSCKSENKKITVRAYDAPADSLGLLRIFNNRSFGKPGLVIATLPNGMVESAAAIAKRRHLNIIFNSAAKSDFLKDNPYAAIALTSTISQCKAMVDYMMNTFRNDNVILVYRTLKREDELAKIFREQINLNNSSIKLNQLNASKDEVSEILKYIRSDKKNLIFIVSSDEAFVSPLISLLNEHQEIDSNIVNIVGLPTWQQFESIDFMNFSNLNYFVFENNFIDYNDQTNNIFRKRFISRYYSDPLPSAYNGFNLIYRIGQTLNKQSTNMDSLIQQSFSENDNQYQFEKVDSGGYENVKISILKLKDYNFIPLPVNTGLR